MKTTLSIGAPAMDKVEECLQMICHEIWRWLQIKTMFDGANQNDHTEWLRDDLVICGPAITLLLYRQADLITQAQSRSPLVEKRLDDLILLAKEKFYAYPFKDVPRCWRRLFTDASILKAFILVSRNRLEVTHGERSHDNAFPDDSNIIDTVVRVLDLAIIMAGAPGPLDIPTRREWIERIMDLLGPLCEHYSAIEGARPSKRRKFNSFDDDDLFPESKVFVPAVQHGVARTALPSFDKFDKHMAALGDQDIGPRPLILEQVMEHWPARNEHPWRRPSYLLSKTLNGRRLVPVEVGRSYVDEGWGQKIITFGEFMRDYLLQIPGCVSASNGTNVLEQESPGYTSKDGNSKRSLNIGYLAQHDLLTQIPSLRFDIRIPDYCYTVAPPPHPSSPLASKHSAVPTLEEPLLNAWLGPAGTISPMHVDPYHNILAQVVGRKYIRLYAPRESAKLYPRGIEDGGVDMCNTSALDIGILEGWDGTKEDQREALRKHPLYSRAEYVDLILEEGECLYIPLGWWHYVRSLTVSFSISFWWN